MFYWHSVIVFLQGPIHKIIASHHQNRFQQDQHIRRLTFGLTWQTFMLPKQILPHDILIQIGHILDKNKKSLHDDLALGPIVQVIEAIDVGYRWLELLEFWGYF